MLSAKRNCAAIAPLSFETHIKAISDNSDIMMEILLKLPMKDVLRFKCVCKQWLSMISDPVFGYNYCRFNPKANFIAGLFLYELCRPHHPRLNFVFLNGQKIRDPFHSLNFVDASSDIHSILSCNGLLCLCVGNYKTLSLHGRISETPSKSYCICNPTTKKSTKVPDLKRPVMSRLLSIALAFDPQKSIHYKIISVWVFEARYQFSLYSSETRVWKDVLSFEIGKDDNFLFEAGVFWSSAVHWVSKFGPFLCFDVDNELLRTMPATPILTDEETRMIGYFGESCGHLHLVEIYMTHFDVLELQRDYSEWLIIRRVYLNQLHLGAYPSYYWKAKDIKILCILRPGEEEEDTVSLVVATPQSTILYCMSDKVSAMSCRLHHIEKNTASYKWYHAHQYIMSLSSV